MQRASDRGLNARIDQDYPRPDSRNDYPARGDSREYASNDYPTSSTSTTSHKRPHSNLHTSTSYSHSSSTTPNIRVKQRAQVHVQGMTTKTASEETLSYLRSSEQFGKYGRIVKLFFSRRASTLPSATSSSHVPVNLYITYSQPHEAQACISAVDGSVTADGHKLKAIWGTTRYCNAYLRGQRCTNDSCMLAHEQGDEIEVPNYHATNGHASHSSSAQHTAGERLAAQAAKDSGSSREDVINAKHAWKEQQQQQQTNAVNGLTPSSDAVTKEGFPALPASASWANKNAPNTIVSPTGLAPLTAGSSGPGSSHSHSSSISSRLPKAQNHPLPPRPPSRTSALADRLNGESVIGRRHSPSPSVSAPASKATSQPPQSSSTRAPTISSEGDLQKADSVSASANTDQLATSAPPSPSVTSVDPSFLSAAPALPPGLGIASNRPLTPVSEFERTLGTFGDGSSFAFNLAGVLPASSEFSEPTAEARQSLDDTANDELLDTSLSSSRSRSQRQSRSNSATTTTGNDTNAASHSTRPSRDVSPDTSVVSLDQLVSPTSFSAHSHFGLGRVSSELDDLLANGLTASVTSTSSQNNANVLDQSVYHGMFNPFSMVGAVDGGADFGTSQTGLQPPPGFSRPGTTSSAVEDGSSGSGSLKPPPGLGVVGNLDIDGTSITNARHRSRFGFARPGSAERSVSTPTAVSNAAHAAANAAAVADLFKGMNGISILPSTGNGRISPARSLSAASSSSGIVAASPAFSSAVNGGIPQSFIANSALPPPSAAKLPEKQAVNGANGPSTGRSLADLFPGLDLDASLSQTSSTIPPALAKSLGINLDSIDLTASSASLESKIANFTPMVIGSGNGIASQPLPPANKPASHAPASSSLQTSLSSSSGHLSTSGPSRESSTSSSSGSSAHTSTPPGFAASRQSKQAQALAQQAHQAHMAAQQAARAAQAQAAAAATASASQAQNYQQHGGYHGRPPSAMGGDSAHSLSGKSLPQGDVFGQFMGMTSPPMAPNAGAGAGYSDSAGRFQDPAIVSFAGLNGYPGHNPYAAAGGIGGYPHQHHGPPPGMDGQNGLPPPPGMTGGVASGPVYSSYHPLPRPSQQIYNPYLPVGPVGMGGMGMSQPGAFGMLRR